MKTFSLICGGGSSGLGQPQTKLPPLKQEVSLPTEASCQACMNESISECGENDRCVKTGSKSSTITHACIGWAQEASAGRGT